jgi:hypothetical protein
MNVSTTQVWDDVAGQPLMMPIKTTALMMLSNMNNGAITYF